MWCSWMDVGLSGVQKGNLEFYIFDIIATLEFSKWKRPRIFSKIKDDFEFFKTTLIKKMKDYYEYFLN